MTKINMEQLFLALSDKTRLRLLNLMRENEVCVNYLAEVLEESQPKISRHLAYLRNAELVSARRAGKWMNYKIDIPENAYAAALIGNIIEWLKSQEVMQNDYARLSELTDFSSGAKEITNPSHSHTSDIPHIITNHREELEVFLL